MLGDEEFGQNADFLDGLPDGLDYFCEVPANTRLLLEADASDHEGASPGGLIGGIIEARDTSVFG